MSTKINLSSGMQNYADKKGFDYDNHLTNEINRSLSDDKKIDDKEAQFLTKIIDEYGRQNIKVKKGELERLAKEFLLNYQNFSKIGPTLEKLIKQRANLERKKSKKENLIQLETHSRLETPITIYETKEKVKNTLDLGEYIEKFKTYKGKINGPKTLNRACERLGINKENFQKVIGTKVDGYIGNKTWRAYKSKIVDKLKYSHYGKHGEIEQSEEELKASRERIKEIETGKKFGEWLEKHGPKGRPHGNCGKGVYRNINNFFRTLGIKRAIKIDRGRHGSNWDNILEDPSNLDPRIKVVKTKINYPSEASVGSVINFESGRNFVGSPGKKKYGHVEIAGNDGFYYDGISKKPGGSASKVSESKNTPEQYAKKTGFTGYAYQFDIA